MCTCGMTKYSTVSYRQVLREALAAFLADCNSRLLHNLLKHGHCDSVTTATCSCQFVLYLEGTMPSAWHALGTKYCMASSKTKVLHHRRTVDPFPPQSSVAAALRASCSHVCAKVILANVLADISTHIAHNISGVHV